MFLVNWIYELILEMAMRTLADIDVNGKTCFVRVDMNVPFAEDGTISDDTRIREVLPTFKHLLANNAKVIVAAHLGRPKGQVVEKYRLAPVAQRLGALLEQDVQYSPDNLANYPESASSLQAGKLMLLENIRFESGEEANADAFAKKLATGVDVYVNDAFGASHRAHASTAGMAQFVPVSVAGLLMEKELAALAPLLDNTKQPFTAIIGGSKVSTKITVLEKLLDNVQHLIIGGGMTYTFMKAQGGNIGQSLLEEEHIETALTLLEKAKAKGVEVHLASDVLTADDFSASANTTITPAMAIDDGFEGVDAGPETLQRWEQVIANSQTILWNGPVGVFEIETFSNGTRTVAKTLLAATKRGATTVLGGGDTVAAIGQFDLPRDGFTHVSTGGGASLEFLEGKLLPGVAALTQWALV
jgi:phosphoglycerate kinase